MPPGRDGSGCTKSPSTETWAEHWHECRMRSARPEAAHSRKARSAYSDRVRRVGGCRRHNGQTMTRTVLVLNGPNLNLLGTREPHIYGSDTLVAILADLRAHAARLDATIVDFQSNTEGELVGRLHEAQGTVDGVIFNPGALPTTASRCGMRSRAPDLPSSRHTYPTSMLAKSFGTSPCSHRSALVWSPDLVGTATSSRSTRCCDTWDDRVGRWVQQYHGRRRRAKRPRLGPHSGRARTTGALAQVALVRARSERRRHPSRGARHDRVRSGRSCSGGPTSMRTASR